MLDGIDVNHSSPVSDIPLVGKCAAAKIDEAGTLEERSAQEAKEESDVIDSRCALETRSTTIWSEPGIQELELTTTTTTT